MTALLAAIGKPREAIRAALVHVVFNTLGVLIWIAFVAELALAVTLLSPQSTDLSGAARLAADTPRQIANAHTLFNVANALLFLPLAGLLARLAELVVPDRPLVEEELIRAKYLDDAVLATPSIAMERARREIARMGHLTVSMFRSVLPAMTDGDEEALRLVEESDEAVDLLHRHVVAYLGRISQESITGEQALELLQLVEFANAFEAAADVIETDLVRSGRRRAGRGYRVSPETAKLLEEFHATVLESLEQSVEAMESLDAPMARSVVARKPDIHRLAGRAARLRLERLVAPEEHRLGTFSVEADMLENMRRVFYFAKRVSRGVLDATRREAKGRAREAS